MKGAIIDCCTLNTCMFDANFKLFISLRWNLIVARLGPVGFVQSGLA